MTSVFADNALLGGLFGDEEIAALFAPEAEIAALLAFEAALARAEDAEGVIPTGSGAAISQALEGLSVDPGELIAPTRAAGVVVPGLIKILRGRAGPAGAYIHWGATTQDATDTGLVLRLRDVFAVMERRLLALTTALAEQAISANVVAAYYHDHVFVGWDDRARALDVLTALANGK